MTVIAQSPSASPLIVRHTALCPEKQTVWVWVIPLARTPRLKWRLVRAASSDDYCSYMDMAALWEYFTVEVGTNDGSLVPRMNQLGSLGWEAVGVTGVDRTLGMNRVMVLMKRAILPKPPPVGDISVGWKPDPFGRFSMRWWDGIRWTEHVINNDEKPTLDPPVG